MRARGQASAAEHPIVSGFYPDPTICRVDEDYYLAHSSFEYFPGAPIFHSRDLLSWKQIGNILDRREQLARGDGRPSGGVYGSTLRHHDGRFYFVTTNVGDHMDQIIVTAEDPTGPWSDPVFVPRAVGIDPDLAWDEDGTCYLTWKGPFSGAWGVWQGRLDVTTGEFDGEPYRVWQGSGMAHPEAPHLYRIGDYWYLTLAEGGTERGHSVTVARADRPDGPYEPCPHNPLLSHRSTADPVQNTGHADLVRTGTGEWAAVYLAVRPRGSTPFFHVLGRETFLAGVDWVDGWPVLNERRYEFTPDTTAFADDFTDPELDHRWVAPFSEPANIAAVRSGGGLDLRDPRDGSPGLLCTRVKDFRWEAEAVFEGSGRFEIRVDDRHRYGLVLENGTVRAEAQVGDVRAEFDSVAVPSGAAVVLRIAAVEFEARTGTGLGPDDLVLSAGGTVLARLDGRYLSTEVATGYTGRVLGVGAAGQSSRVIRFAYTPEPRH
ncbi:glycoside hydrolase family 43 protein [Promicromonospora panici]|uniref:glycoside hydrolase family 43 protein n=1 Tax=Promicromonospora panici TaxID=2219658 RepID=UPI00101BF00F|nr:glycoside hydrolase family 43 protein [Promicromonospora panici]